jgi:hypothetical protein
MHRTTLTRLVVVLMLATFAGYDVPAALAGQPPTKAQAAVIVKGDVYSPAAAKKRAGKLLTLVRLPTGATLHPGTRPAHGPTPGSLDADIYTSYAAHWWTAPGTVATVTTWISQHPPIGFRPSGAGLGPTGKVVLFAPVSASAGCCATIDVTVAKHAGGVAITVDGFVQWQLRRTAAETVPDTVTTALLAVGSAPSSPLPSLPDAQAQVSGSALKPLTTLLNRLPATHAEPLPCPYSPNWSTATFRYGSHVVLFSSPDACPYVEVTVDGDAAPTLAGNMTDLVATALGVQPVQPTM